MEIFQGDLTNAEGHFHFTRNNSNLEVKPNILLLLSSPSGDYPSLPGRLDGPLDVGPRYGP